MGEKKTRIDIVKEIREKVGGKNKREKKDQ